MLGRRRGPPGAERDQGPNALNRVLVLSASAGSGHVRAAQVLERALVATGRVREVRHVDILQYTSKLFRRVYAQAYLDLVNRAPEVLGWLYDYFDEPWKHERLRLALDKLNATRFIRLLEDYAPEWAVSTHFLPAQIIGWLRSKGRLATRGPGLSALRRPAADPRGGDRAPRGPAAARRAGAGR
jgi:processive 1,2-diacylglycerol beta-glucosyltransferase